MNMNVIQPTEFTIAEIETLLGEVHADFDHVRALRKAIRQLLAQLQSQAAELERLRGIVKRKAKDWESLSHNMNLSYDTACDYKIKRDAAHEILQEMENKS